MTADRTAPDRPAADLEPAGRHRRRHRVRPPAASVTGRLADATHPAVRDAAARLAEGCASPRQQLERFVLFVRDDIRFGFPPDGDLTAASGTLALGIGQCNTKGTLLLALCRAAGIPARLHFAPIRRSIQRGLYTGVWYLLLPRHLSHAWLEVSIDGRWRPVDAYINDTRFCRAAERELRRRGWREGFSLSGTCAGAGGAFDVDASSFIQMDAVEGMTACGTSRPAISGAPATGTGPGRSGRGSTTASPRASTARSTPFGLRARPASPRTGKRLDDLTPGTQAARRGPGPCLRLARR